MTKTLDRILNVGKGLVFGLATIAALASCGDKKITGKIEIDPEHSGMIHGKVATASIENNRVVYVNGKRGATVKVNGTNFETQTNFSGEYSIDEIPIGTYTIKGELSYGSGYRPWKEGYQSVTIQPLLSGITEVPTLEIDPSIENENKILHGKVYWNSGATYSGRRLSLHKEKTNPKGPGEQLESTITSPDGSYAFYFKMSNQIAGNPAYYIVSQEGKVMLDGEQRGWVLPGYFDKYHVHDGIVDKNLTVQP